MSSKGVEVFTHNFPVDENGSEDILVEVTSLLWSEDFNYEALPARKISENEYQICCIPMLIHDINLGDYVKVDHQDSLVFKKVTHDAGHYGFRIAVPEHGGDTPEQLNKVQRLILERTSGSTIEFNSHTFFAVDASNLSAAIDVANLLEQLEKSGLISGYDTVRSKMP